MLGSHIHELILPIYRRKAKEPKEIHILIIAGPRPVPLINPLHQAMIIQRVITHHPAPVMPEIQNPIQEPPTTGPLPAASCPASPASCLTRSPHGNVQAPTRAVKNRAASPRASMLYKKC